MAQPTEFEKIRRNSERLQQVATLLAPAERSDICAKVLAHVIFWWGYAKKCGNMPGHWIFQPHSLLAVKCGLRSEQQSKRAVGILRKSERIETKVRKINGPPRLHLQLNHGIEKLLAHLSSKFPDDAAPLAERRAFQRVWDEALRLDLRNSPVFEDQTLHHVMQKSLPFASTATLLVEVDRVLKIASDRSLKSNKKMASPSPKVTLSKEVSNPTLSKEVSPVTLSIDEIGYKKKKDKDEKTCIVTPCVTSGSNSKKDQVFGKKESTSPSAPKTPQSPPAAPVAPAVGAGAVVPAAAPVAPAVGAGTLSPETLAKWKAQGKAQLGSAHSAKATPRAAFEAAWLDVYGKEFEDPLPPFTATQRGKMNHILSRAATVGLQSDDLETVRAFSSWCVKEWPKLTDEIKFAAGLYKTPGYPDVGFLLKHIGHAVPLYLECKKLAAEWTKPVAPVESDPFKPKIDEFGLVVPVQGSSVQIMMAYAKARKKAKLALEGIEYEPN